ncbi:hypothetical protein P879_08322, partial [Paragonimus westermani]
TIRSKCENKNDRLCSVRDRLKSRGDWIEQTSSTIAQAARFIQTLVTDCPFADAKENEKETDEQQTAEKTEAVIQSVLSTLMSIKETGKSRSKSAITSHEHTVTTIDSLNFVLTVEQDSSYEFVSSEDDDDSRNSEISDPHSSRAEDTELEISEPEDDQPINFVALENDAQFGQTQKTESITSPTSCSPQSDINAEVVLSEKQNLPVRFERLDRVWSELHVSNLERYGPASKEWRTLLAFLAANRDIWSADLFSRNMRFGRSCLRPGDLKIIPTTSAIIPSKKQQLIALKRLRAKNANFLRSDDKGSVVEHKNNTRNIGIQTWSTARAVFTAQKLVKRSSHV